VPVQHLRLDAEERRAEGPARLLPLEQLERELTSSAVNSAPSEKVPPLRRKKIQRLPSWDIDQRSANPGSAFKVWGSL